MKALNLVTLILTIAGGISWGLVGLADFNVVAALFGDGTMLSRVVYVLIGLSALYQLVPWSRALRVGEVPAEASHRL